MSISKNEMRQKDSPHQEPGNPNQGKRDIVLFLGAGFSRDAYLPTMPEFGKHSQEQYESLIRKHAHKKRDSSEFRYAAPMLVEAGEIFTKFQQFCKRSPTVRDNDVQNIENIFCIAEAISESGWPCIEIDNQEYRIDEFIRHIQPWLWKIYHRYPPIDTNRKHKTKPETYTSFFKVLRQLGLLRDIAVITTNYDLVFEYLSWDNKVPCYYPLQESEFESISIGGGTKPFVYLKRQDSTELNRPVLCKLHGSINYFQDRSNDSMIHVANLIGGDKPIGNSGIWNDNPAILALDAIWCIRNKYGNNFTPAIIPPTYAKLTQQRWLRKIWKTALKVLSNAKKIIFIGYSMPHSDGFMRALVHSALAIRACDNAVPPKVYVIDPCEKTHQRYRELFHGIYEPMPPLAFSEATKSVIPEILNNIDC
jgi:hypothetical protein